jgi:hypothetical protein
MFKTWSSLEYKWSQYQYHQKYDDITYVQNLMIAKRHILQLFLRAKLPFTLHEDHSQIMTHKKTPTITLEEVLYYKPNLKFTCE